MTLTSVTCLEVALAVEEKLNFGTPANPSQLRRSVEFFFLREFQIRTGNPSANSAIAPGSGNGERFLGRSRSAVECGDVACRKN